MISWFLELFWILLSRFPFQTSTIFITNMALQLFPFIALKWCFLKEGNTDKNLSTSASFYWFFYITPCKTQKQYDLIPIRINVHPLVCRDFSVSRTEKITNIMSSSIYKVIRPVLNFLLFFFYDKILPARKSAKKHQKALKSTANLRFIDLKFIDTRFIDST